MVGFGYVPVRSPPATAPESSPFCQARFPAPSVPNNWFAAPSAAGKTQMGVVADEVGALNPTNPVVPATRISPEVEMLSLIHISEPTRLLSISYAVFCL